MLPLLLLLRALDHQLAAANAGAPTKAIDAAASAAATTAGDVQAVQQLQQLATPPPPPPVVNATCAAVLNAWCNSNLANGPCVKSISAFGNGTGLPMFGIWSGECGTFNHSTQPETCGAGPPRPQAWRCYSHLAVDAEHKWDGRHPTGCTSPELQGVYDQCIGAGPPLPPAPGPPTQLKLSSVLGSGMVLQRSPALARIWGEAVPGDVVTVTVAAANKAEASAQSSASIKTTADIHGRWAVRAAMAGGGNPYTVTISSGGAKPAAPIVLTDVLAGEVHVCSGQSNMVRLWSAPESCASLSGRSRLPHTHKVMRFFQDFTLAGVFNASQECAAAANSMLRLFKTTRRTSAVPLHELSAPPVPYLNWNRSSAASACGSEWVTSLDRSTGFSAACFFYAQELQQLLQVPVGAIDTSWGGTNIEK